MNVSTIRINETAREFAFRNIKHAIVHLELKPGQMVSENVLSIKLGVSRTPVREALIELARYGVVEIIRQRGSRISLIDYKRVEESQFFRKVLEEGVVKLLAEEHGSIDLEPIQKNIQLQEYYFTNKRYNDLLDLDDSFHELLFLMADKMQCFSTLHSMSIPFDRVRNLSLSSVKNLKIVEDHKEIVKAIVNHDAQQAVKAMNLHLSRYNYDKTEILKAYPASYFTQEVQAHQNLATHQKISMLR